MNPNSVFDVKGAIEVAFEKIIDALGMDVEDPNLADTPRRVAMMLREMTRGTQGWEEEAATMLNVTFPSSYDEMVVVTDIRVVGLCPHHFMPIEYWMTVGYIPQKLDVGLSKIPRVCELLAARAVMQEQLTDDIANVMQTHLKPTGMGVMIRGRHGCMAYRGVRQENAIMATCRLIGSFKTDASTKAEFMSHAISS